MQETRACEICLEPFLARLSTTSMCPRCQKNKSAQNVGTKWTIEWCEDRPLIGSQLPRCDLEHLCEDMIATNGKGTSFEYCHDSQTWTRVEDVEAAIAARTPPPAKQPGAPGTRYGIKYCGPRALGWIEGKEQR